MDISNVLNKFNVYKDGALKVGVSAEITLPEIEFKSESVEAAGLLGAIDGIAPGHTDAIEQEIPFVNADQSFFDTLANGQNLTLTIRGSQQVTDSSTGAQKHIPVRVVFGGVVKKIKFGSLKQAGTGSPSITLSLTYYLHEYGGAKKVELDKLNGVCIINGNDLMAEINSQC